MLYLKFQTIAVFVRQILLSQDDIRCRRPNTRVVFPIEILVLKRRLYSTQLNLSRDEVKQVLE